jgi:hypothetical protein
LKLHVISKELAKHCYIRKIIHLESKSKSKGKRKETGRKKNTD